MTEAKKEKMLRLQKKKNRLYRKYLAARDLAQGFVEQADELGGDYQDACIKYYDLLRKMKGSRRV